MNVFIGKEENALRKVVTPKAQDIFVRRIERLKTMFPGAKLDFVDNWSISNAKLVGLKTTSQGYVPDFRPYVSDVPSLSRTYVLKRKGLPDIDLRSYYEYFKLSDRNDVHTLIKILKEIEKTENAPKISDAMQRIKKLLP